MVKCKTETLLNNLLLFYHNGRAVTHKTQACGAGMEHKGKPVMQHRFPHRHEGSWAKLAVLDHFAAALVYWDDAVAGERQGQGCDGARVPETQQSKPVAWKSLCPTWCANVAYPDLEFTSSAGSRQVGRALKVLLRLQGRAGSSGREEQGEEQMGSKSLQGPPCGKHLITLRAGRSTDCFIDGELRFLLKCFSLKWCFALRKVFSHQLQLFL